MNNNGILNNKREGKLYRNINDITFDNKKDTTNISTTSYNFNNSSNNFFDYQQLRNTSIISIDDKYKYLENPFTIPENPPNPKEERRAKVIENINKNNNNSNNRHNKSQSVDTIRYKKSENIQKRANYLGNHLFGEENEI